MENQNNLEKIKPLENDFTKLKEDRAEQKIENIERITEEKTEEISEVTEIEKIESNEEPEVQKSQPSTEKPIEEVSLEENLNLLKNSLPDSNYELDPETNPEYRKIIFLISEKIREENPDNDSLKEKKIEETANYLVGSLPKEQQLATKEFLKQVFIDEIRKNNLRAGV